MANTNKLTQQIELKTLPIAKLKMAKYNPREIDPANYQALKASIRDFGQRENLIVNSDMTVISGHMRLRAMQELGQTEAQCDVLHLNKNEEKKLNLIMNNPLMQGRFDTLKVDALLAELKLAGNIDDYRLPELGTLDLSNDSDKNKANKQLSKDFIVPPFSIIDTRREEWQERKRAWQALGIKSETGRNGDLMIKSTGFMAKEIEQRGGGTSIFDPALCEVLYTWFGLPGGSVLDPFAGGSVRGIVAHKLGLSYTGIELRPEQVTANVANAKEVLKNVPDNLLWLEGDSRKALGGILDESIDFVFSCPPYADLEKYSEDPADLSNMPYAEFQTAYEDIIKQAITKLKPNWFACFVVGEVRGKRGTFYNLVGDTVVAFEMAGAAYYNEIILITPAGSLPLRVGRQFNSGRKVGRSHQNVLVFYKGDPAKIKGQFKEVKLPEDTGVTAELVPL